ncbi:MAG: Ada metal-binding domain-containing protein [Cyanobacteria bacterium P01_F01_bin.33]
MTARQFVLSDQAMWRAILTRDSSLDGSFLYGVCSTGIYCRPTCPSRRPRRDRVSFFASPEAAERAGFRACKRCAPHERDSSIPAEDIDIASWHVTSQSR